MVSRLRVGTELPQRSMAGATPPELWVDPLIDLNVVVMSVRSKELSFSGSFSYIFCRWSLWLR